MLMTMQECRKNQLMSAIDTIKEYLECRGKQEIFQDSFDAIESIIEEDFKEED